MFGLNLSAAFLGFALVVVTSTAQVELAFKISKISDHIYELSNDASGYTVKIIASVGDDGLLLVDAGQMKTGDDLKAALQSISKSCPDIIISTHSHIEHVGGNLAFGSGPLIIGHQALRKKLQSGAFLFNEFSEGTIPRLTFADSLTMFFNGEEIKLLSFAGPCIKT